MDVYVGHNFDSHRCVRIIDFNVFGLPTDGLMFDWDELEKRPIDQVSYFGLTVIRPITFPVG